MASLCAAVMTFLVPLEMSLSKVSGTTAQVPTKPLSPSRIRHVQGNSSGLDSPCFLRREGKEAEIELSGFHLHNYRKSQCWNMQVFIFFLTFPERA